MLSFSYKMAFNLLGRCRTADITMIEVLQLFTPANMVTCYRKVARDI